MACQFGYIEDACGCLIGYSMPLKTEDNEDITAYPVNVLNVNGVDLGEAETPSEYVSLWNSDEDNQDAGVLSIGSGSYCFTLSRIAGVTPPSRVLGVAPEPEPIEMYRFIAGFTELDTTGETPTESEYVDSVNDAQDGVPADETQEVTGEITVEFENETDEVCFLFVFYPAEIPAFTKWSVEGDELQQDQPIDQTFAGTNVWFKSEFAGSPVYITRLQTTFSGPVRFHN